MIISVLDSYFLQVKRQMALVDASQLFGQVVQARDWPLTPPVYGALYLLVLNHNPVGGTQAQELYEYECQWTWLLAGTDIGPDQQTANRGDRYRQTMKIAENLRQANNPRYGQKFDVTADGVSGELILTPASSTYPVSATEQVYWSALKFMPKQANTTSGLIYGAAAVQLYGYSDVLASLAA